MMPLALMAASCVADTIFNHTLEMQHHFFGHVKPLALAPCDANGMASLYSLGQDNQNEVQYDLFDHVTPLTPVSSSHDADCIDNGTFTFLMSR